MSNPYNDTHSSNSGPLVESNSRRLQFRAVIKERQKRLLALFGLLLAVTNITFIAWLINPSHISAGSSRFITILSVICFIFIVAIELVRILQAATLWFFASKAKDPIPLAPEKNIRVAILTTIVPSKEPLDMVMNTLRAMKRIEYEGQVDVWILDEGNDERVKRLANELGVKHFSRSGIAAYNQKSGEFKAKSKAGNHNAWRAEHEQDYDVVAQMDPDHVPFTNFLSRTLGYFKDPNIAFVVAPQVYGNQDHRWLTRASASQAYIFHGILQRGGNNFGSPLLIGTNHLYRTKAWKQIGGYQDSIIEDHLTSMALHGTINPETGARWRSVYTPDIISVGEGPTSWTDYFNQQKRWAYGIWEILLHHAKALDKRLKPGQSLYYATLQFFYPSVALSWLMGNIVSAVYFILGIHSMTIHSSSWLFFWGLSFTTQIGFFLWLNHFNLNVHEQKHGGLDALFITLATTPVYVSSALAALARRPLSYTVTAKGNLRAADTYKTFISHIYWAMIAVSLIVIGLLNNRDMKTQILWECFILLVTCLPLFIFICREKLTQLYVIAASAYMLKTFRIRTLP